MNETTASAPTTLHAKLIPSQNIPPWLHEIMGNVNTRAEQLPPINFGRLLTEPHLIHISTFFRALYLSEFEKAAMQKSFVELVAAEEHCATGSEEERIIHSLLYQKGCEKQILDLNQTSRVPTEDRDGFAHFEQFKNEVDKFDSFRECHLRLCKCNPGLAATKYLIAKSMKHINTLQRTSSILTLVSQRFTIELFPELVIQFACLSGQERR
jgi:hypothetical protein